MTRPARLALALLCLLLPAPASAWWDYGHQTVARIAMQSAAPATRAAIGRLLAHETELATPTCRVRSIEEAATWPDCIKALKDRFSYAYSWHYQNVDICRPFDPKSACRDGNCVSAQIERNARLLADRGLPARERLMALAFLVHFVGDLHMPLHAGDHGDKGGNEVRADYGFIRGSNLHTVWDGYLADRAISSPPAGASGLLGSLAPDQRRAMQVGSIIDWGQESWELARSSYGMVFADPCSEHPGQPSGLTQEQIGQLLPAVRLQVTRGGIRLARLLDEALA